MTAHLKQDEPDTANFLDTMKQGVLGKPVSRIEGLAKVTGTAPYAAEYPVENLAEGVLVTATIVRGEVVSIDKDAALAMPGVLAVIDDKCLTTRAAQGRRGRGRTGRTITCEAIRELGDVSRENDLQTERRSDTRKRIRHSNEAARTHLRLAADANRTARGAPNPAREGSILIHTDT